MITALRITSPTDTPSIMAKEGCPPRGRSQKHLALASCLEKMAKSLHMGKDRNPVTEWSKGQSNESNLDHSSPTLKRKPSQYFKPGLSKDMAAWATILDFWSRETKPSPPTVSEQRLTPTEGCLTVAITYTPHLPNLPLPEKGKPASHETSLVQHKHDPGPSQLADRLPQYTYMTGHSGDGNTYCTAGGGHNDWLGGGSGNDPGGHYRPGQGNGNGNGGDRGRRRRRDEERDADDPELIEFICPFVRHDAVRYQECLKYTLRRISDVRQHLQRHHALGDYYCSSCLRRWGSDCAEYAAHVVSSECTLPPAHEHLSGDEVEALKALNRGAGRRPRHQSAEAWMDMFRLLFPNHVGPVSPFRKSYFDEVAGWYRQTNGPKLAALVKGELDRGVRDSGSLVGRIQDVCLDARPVEPRRLRMPNLGQLQPLAAGSSTQQQGDGGRDVPAMTRRYDYEQEPVYHSQLATQTPMFQSDMGGSNQSPQEGFVNVTGFESPYVDTSLLGQSMVYSDLSNTPVPWGASPGCLDPSAQNLGFGLIPNPLGWGPYRPPRAYSQLMQASPPQLLPFGASQEALLPKPDPEPAGHDAWEQEQEQEQPLGATRWLPAVRRVSSAAQPKRKASGSGDARPLAKRWN